MPARRRPLGGYPLASFDDLRRRADLLNRLYWATRKDFDDMPFPDNSAALSDANLDAPYERELEAQDRAALEEYRAEVKATALPILCAMIQAAGGQNGYVANFDKTIDGGARANSYIDRALETAIQFIESADEVPL